MVVVVVVVVVVVGVVGCEDRTGSGGGGGDGAAVLIPTKQPPVYTIKLLKLCNLLNMPGQENEIQLVDEARDQNT